MKTNKKVICIKETKHNAKYRNCYNGTVKVGEIFNVHLINGTKCLLYNNDVDQWITNMDAPCGISNFEKVEEVLNEN